MIWFPFYSSDFIGATVGLSCQEVSIYNWMLTLYYELGPFPEERTRTYRIVRCESDEQKRTVDYILGHFFVLKDGYWWNERAEKEKVLEAQRHIEATERGKRSAIARREKYGTAQPMDPKAFRKPFESVSKASGNASELPTPTPTPTPTPKPIASPDLSLSEIPTKLEEKAEAKSDVRATRFTPAPTMPADWRGYCKAKRADLDPDVTYEKFCNHWKAKPGAAGRKLDWTATWRNWVLNEGPARTAGNQKAGQAERVAQMLFGNHAEAIDG